MHEDSIVSGITNSFFKNEDLIIGSFKRLPKHSTVPFAWPYRLNQTKELSIKLGNSLHKIQVDHDMKKEECASSEGRTFIVEVLVTANSKKVKITEK